MFQTKHSWYVLFWSWTDDYAILFVAFNARTANLTDNNEIDTVSFDFADIDASSVFDTDIFQNVKVNVLSYERFSQDKQTNITSRTLIDMCKGHDVLLLKSRANQTSWKTYL